MITSTYEGGIDTREYGKLGEVTKARFKTCPGDFSYLFLPHCFREIACITSFLPVNYSLKIDVWGMSGEWF